MRLINLLRSFRYLLLENSQTKNLDTERRHVPYNACGFVVFSMAE